MKRDYELELILENFCRPEILYDFLEEHGLVLDEINAERLIGFVLEERMFFKKRLEEKIHELQTQA